MPELFWDFFPIKQMTDNLRNDSGRQQHYDVIKLLSANISKHRRAIRPPARVQSEIGSILHSASCRNTKLLQGNYTSNVFECVDTHQYLTL